MSFIVNGVGNPADYLMAKKYESKNEFIHINLNNVGYIKVIEMEENSNKHIFEIIYRKKAMEKAIKFEVNGTYESVKHQFNLQKFYNFENNLINVKSVIFVEEENDKTKDFIKIHFYFEDGQNLSFRTKKGRWENWRRVNLK